MTMTLVSTTTVGSGGVATIEFTNIPQTGTDLLLLTNFRSSLVQPTDSAFVYLNSDTTNSNYEYNLLRATMFAGSGGNSNQAITGSFRPFFAVPADESSTNTFTNDKVLISNYTSTVNKSVSIEAVSENFNSGNALAEAQINIQANRYTSSSAITSILLDLSGGNFVQHSSVSLYIIS
jgi:hypothetical protein